MGGRCPVLLAARGNDHALEVDYQLKLLSCFCPCVSFQSTLGLQCWRCVDAVQCILKAARSHCKVTCNELVCPQSMP